MLKTCFKCGVEKNISEFHCHPQMADGHLGKCKECAKADVRANYATKREQYSAYEQQRASEPERKRKVLKYQATRRAKNPEKYLARAMVASALKSGLLKKLPCETCNLEKVQAHHDDYSKPLEVRWLCFKHHREIGHQQKVVSNFR